MPTASTFRRFCTIHQAVAKFSSELVHFVRASETIQMRFPVFWVFFAFFGGGVGIHKP